MNSSVTIVLSEQDLTQAQWLHFMTNLRRPATIFRLCALWLIVVAGVFGLLALSGAMTSDLIAIVPAIALLGLIAPPIIVRLLAPRIARKTLKQQKTIRPPIDYSWSENGLAIASPYGNGLLPWSHFFQWAEDKHLLLLFESANLYRIIPKRALSHEQIVDLKHHLRHLYVRSS